MIYVHISQSRKHRQLLFRLFEKAIIYSIERSTRKLEMKQILDLSSVVENVHDFG